MDEAVTLAIELQKTEQLTAAHELYRRVLETAPDHPVALHFAGVLAQQQGRLDDAVALIERSLKLKPGQADWHSNLAIVQLSRGDAAQALAALGRAIDLDPAHANAHCNRGVALKALGRLADAESAYRTAIQMDAEHIEAYTNLGILLAGMNRTPEAVACYCKVITLRPRHREARRRLAIAHCVLGEVDKAVRIFEDWLAEEPGDPIALHMLAACSGRGVPTRASDAFVEKTFDHFAASFEANLQQLAYRAPALIAAMLEHSGLAPARQLEALDAGCGTGLCGPLVRQYARRLTGVDLSAGMLAHAEAKNVYDALIQSELTEYLSRNPKAFDLIVSADTLVYFGDLGAVCAAAASALRPGGLLVFTLEHAADAAPGEPYRLERHGRYSHRRASVERLLEEARLRPEVFAADLRMEAGAPVAGLVICATRRATHKETDACAI